MKIHRSALLAAFAVMILNVSIPAAQTKLSYSTDIKPIFAANCSSCHNWGQAYANVVGPTSKVSPTKGLRIVYPAKPDSSVIVWRLEGKTASGTALNTSPNHTVLLPADTVRKIRDWITQGAPETVTAIKSGTWGNLKKLFQ